VIGSSHADPKAARKNILSLIGDAARMRPRFSSIAVEFLETSQRLVQPIEDQGGVDDLVQTMTGKVRF
jgi:hypothetical protein